MRKSIIYSGLAAGYVVWMLGGTVRAAVYDDDFNDNTIGSQWTLLEDDASAMSLHEQNQRLELITDGSGPSSTDALYLSNGLNGFRLSTNQDFHISIDYHYSATHTGSSDDDVFALDFGVGRDLEGTDSAAIGFGSIALLGSNVGGALVAYRVNDAEVKGTPVLFTSATGTFDISYDRSNDILTFTIGTWSDSLPAGLVRGQWNADSLYVSFGGRGNGFSTASGDAWLDNFKIITGQTTPVPEPVPAAVMGLAALLWLVDRRRARRRIA